MNPPHHVCLLRKGHAKREISHKCHHAVAMLAEIWARMHPNRGRSFPLLHTDWPVANACTKVDHFPMAGAKVSPSLLNSLNGPHPGKRRISRGRGRLDVVQTQQCGSLKLSNN